MSRLSEKQKTLEFEKIVLTGTIDEIEATYKEIGPIELPARSLGMACRFRGLEVVKTLVELGFYFHRPTEPSFRGKYDCGYTSAGRYQVTSDYLLLLLDDCDCQSSFGIHSGYKDRYSGEYTDEAFDNLQLISEEERAEIIEYLFQNRKSAHFQADKLLYYSIISQSDFAIKTLKSLGVVIPKQEKEYLTKGGTGLDFQDYQKSLFRDDPKDLKKQFEYWFAELDDNEKLIVYKTYAEEYADVLFSPEVYSFIKGRADFSKVSKKNILMKLVENNNAAAVTVLCNDGWAEKKTLRDSLISIANEKGSTDTLAVLIDYKNRTSDPIKEMEEEDRKLMRELNANPMSVASLKKLFAYEALEDGTYRITRYKGDQTVVAVPEKIGKVMVTSIGAGAFSSEEGYCKNEEEIRRRNAITVITLPDSIDTIEFRAFSKCKGLTKIDLPSALKTIESETFSGCVSLTGINLPDSITTIGTRAFHNCVSMTEIELPDSMNMMGFMAFDGCENLKKIGLPTNLKTIESFTFSGCKALESINLPDSITTIEANAFQNCDNLSEVRIPEGVEVIDNDFSNTKWANANGDGPLYYKDILICYKGASGNVEIKDGTRMIAGGAFKQSGVTEVTIPDSVMRACYGAFNGCEALNKVCLGNGIKAIGVAMFNGCSSLKNVEIGQSVKIIGNSAFRDCKALETIIIPKSVEKIEGAAFYGCSGLKDVYITEKTIYVDELKSILRNDGLTVHTPVGSAAERLAADYKVKIAHDTPDNPSDNTEDFIMIIEGGILTSCYGSKSRVEISEEVTKIGDRAFENNRDITEVIIPETVTAIGFCSFLNCENLKHFEAPSHLESIGGFAFRDCKQLETVTLNEGLSEIAGNTFRDCESLKSIVIPTSVKKIESYAFENCKRLETISFEGNGILFGGKGYIDTFRGCESLKTIEIPIVTQRWLDRLDRMFENCVSLEEIHFTKDSDFKEVSSRMFAGCSKLEEIELPECVESIAKDAFEGCTELKRLFLSGKLEQDWKNLPTYYKNLYASGVARKIINGTANEFELNEVLPYIRKQKKRLLESMPDNQDLIQVIENNDILTKKKQPSKEPKAKSQVSELGINGGVFVTTGLSLKDEAWVKEQVEAKGGAFKGGFVKSITCLVINPDYERETTKLTKTKALIAEGKDIKIVTLSEFKELVE